MLRRLAPILGALLLAASIEAAAESRPRPPGLEPNVRFWTRIYTEVDTRGGLIHDSDRLDVVYEVQSLPPGLSARERERRVEGAKRRISGVLLQLASGQRSGLSPESERVLGLWPPGTSNATLRAAARNVRFQLGQADKFRAGLIRSGLWRAHIERVLAEEGVPPELVALPHVESSFNPHAYSRVGAAGLWQFTRSTGRRYMRVDDVVDERMDPHKASVAAARLLRNNYRYVESWPLAITGYNHGVAGMARAARMLGTKDIATIVDRYEGRTFGFASRNFYAEFLAASEIDRDPARFFGPIETLSPLEYEVVTLDHFYPIASLQRAIGIDLEPLREANLALRPSVWSGAKYVPRGYELRVPRHPSRPPLEQAVASIAPDERHLAQHRDRFYKVQRGDSLSKIAQRLQLGESELMAINGLRSRNSIRAGQVLRLPDHAVAPEPVVVARIEPMPDDRIHGVRRGDTLESIARRYGVSEAQIVAANQLRNRNSISVGQRLRLPAEPGGRPTATPAAEPPATPVVVAEAPVAAEPQVASAREPSPPISDGSPADGPTPPSSEPPASALATPAAPISMEGSAPPAGEPSPPSAPQAPVVIAALESADTQAVVRAGLPLEPALAPAASHEPELLVAPAPAEAAAPPSPDPSNYAVSSDNRITVQADETLGHYAEWLEVRPSVLRRLNRMKPGAPVQIGRSAKLDFSRVTPEVFEQRRLQYHRTLQEEFFEAFVVSGTEDYVLKKGETFWYLAKQRFELPMWLLRQYNPDLDLGSLRAGTRLIVPVIEPREG